MEIRRVLPYILGLVFLAFALGSLPRSQAGGSLLFRSYWLLYVIALAPIAILAVMAALLLFIVRNWRELSEGIGHGMARGKRKRPRSTRNLLVYIFFWALALVVLMTRQATPGAASSAKTIERVIVGDTSSIPGTIQLGNEIGQLSNIVQAGWFNIMFAALVIVCGFVLMQSLRVSMKETSTPSTLYPGKQVEGLEAVEQAMKVADDTSLNPRDRIIACYRQLIDATFKLGAPVSDDQTARELEEKISFMFMLKGRAIHDLTALFEEARYSLHEVEEEDASMAMQYLHSLYAELEAQLDSEL